MEQDKELRETAPEKERLADQQFGATAARDQERVDAGETPEPKSPRAGNKEEDLSDNH